MDNTLSVVIAHYHNFHALNLTLHGFLHSTDLDSDIHTIDDGGPKIPQRLQNVDILHFGLGDRLDLHQHYLEPETTQFRLATARNLGICHAKGERILFLDSDCIPTPNIIAEHKSYGDKPIIVAGFRRNIHRKVVENLTPESYPDLSTFRGSEDTRYKDQEKFLNCFTAPWKVCVGCHLSVPTKILREIGGFNQEFTAWGPEDMELAERLVRAGLKVELRPDLLVFHLDHPLLYDKRKHHEAQELLEKSIKNPVLLRNGGPLLPTPWT